MSTATALLGLLQASLRTRQRLVVENLALRHQLTVLKRSVKRARIEERQSPPPVIGRAPRKKFSVRTAC